MKTDSKIKPYRGGCTDKNWSNTTACPNWCNDGKHDAYPAILTCRPSRRFSQKNIKADDFSDSVFSYRTATIFNCPGKSWYFCDDQLSTKCDNGSTEFQAYNYTKAIFLGTPPISSTEHIATANSHILTSSTEQITTANASVTKSAASITLTNQPTCTEIIHQSSLPATAIGVGLGVPFGIAAIGFLVFLFWRDARRKNARGPKQDTSQDKRTIRHNTLTGGEMDGNGLRLELQGTIVNPELYGSEMTQ